MAKPAKKPKPRAKISPKGLEKALRPIKVLILDIDGVLTDGQAFYTEPAGWGASYSLIDGFGIKLLLRNGIEVCFISAGTFLSHRKRAEVLGIRHAYFGDENKLHSLEKICRDLDVKPEDCAYMGDELFDVPVLERVGFAACPPHATRKAKEASHYITTREGGHGAVREICDAMLRGRGIDV